MPVEAYAKVAGQWRSVPEAYVKVAGQWRTVTDQYVKVNGIWREVTTPQPPTPSPGTYILSPTSLFLGSETSGYALFDTSFYRGHISEIRARVSYSGFSSTGFQFSWYGRPSGTYYRQTDVTTPNNTIDHRIDTFNASSLTQFNNGSATGFTITKPAGTLISTWITYVRLNLTIV